MVASAINFAVARRLLQAGKEHRSITLEADAHHLMSGRVDVRRNIQGVVAVYFTGWNRLDPIIAIVIAANIVRIGGQLLRRSVLGLLDRALPAAEQDAIKAVLSRYERDGIRYHALRTRGAGARSFISLHVLVPGDWTVQRGHDLLRKSNEIYGKQIPGSTVFTQLEPIDDPAAWQDNALDRADSKTGPKGN